MTLLWIHSFWRGALLKYWCFCCRSLFRSLLFHSLQYWKYCSVYKPLDWVRQFNSSYDFFFFLLGKHLGLLEVKYTLGDSQHCTTTQFWCWFEEVHGAINTIAGRGYRWSAISCLSFVISTIAGAGWHVFNGGRGSSIFFFSLMREITTVLNIAKVLLLLNKWKGNKVHRYGGICDIRAKKLYISTVLLEQQDVFFF